MNESNFEVSGKILNNSSPNNADFKKELLYTALLGNEKMIAEV